MSVPIHIQILAILGVVKVKVHEEKPKDHSSRLPINSISTGKIHKSAWGYIRRIPFGIIITLIFVVGIPVFTILMPSSDNSTDSDIQNDAIPPLPEKYHDLTAQSYEELLTLDVSEKEKQLLASWKPSIDSAICSELVKMHRDNIDSYIQSYVYYQELQKGC